VRGNGDMKLTDMFVYSIKYLRTQKLKSWLTIIGIVIGTATIVSLVSIGDGIRYDITKQLEGFGSNYMVVIPVNIEGRGISLSIGQAPSSGKLYEKDYDKIRNIPGVKKVARWIYSRTSLQFKDKKITAPVYAGDTEVFDMYPEYMKIQSGRIFNNNEQRVVVLGYDAANKLFGKDEIKVNNKMYIGGEEFRVVGILEKMGTSLSQQDDKSIYIPLREGRELFKSTIGKNEISAMIIESEEGYDVEMIKERIEEQLIAQHKVTAEDKDFSVITADYVNKIVEDITGTLTLFLLLISSVSAVVGGIGISNTMFMSVLERTREIGVLKSIGARSGEILKLFVIEAVIIGMVGGIIGCGIGIGISEIVKDFGISSMANPLFVIIVIVFSALTGAVAGAIPAYNASKIPPVEALNY